MKRGWCPTLYDPMPTGDGLLVRVKPPGARLSPGQARALAEACGRYGNGVLELTQRGNVQIRGLSDATTGPFAASLFAAGLASPPAVERRRAVMPPPLLGDDPGLAADAAAVTARLERAFAEDPRLEALPGKFAVQVDAGGVLGGRPAAASLMVHIAGAGASLHAGDGRDAGVLAGPLHYPGTEAQAFALAPPFGQFDAAMLRALAALAERHDTAIRVTPWRALLLGRVRIGADIAAEAGPNWITDPADPRLRVTACIGAPGCASGSTPTRADAARLAAAMRPYHRVHVSGCAKGCAHPGPAPLTLVGREGRYDLVRNGRAGDRPEALAQTLDGIDGAAVP